MGCGTQESVPDRGCNTGRSSGGERLAQGQILEGGVKEADEDQGKDVVWRWKKQGVVETLYIRGNHAQEGEEEPGGTGRGVGQNLSEAKT